MGYLQFALELNGLTEPLILCTDTSGRFVFDFGDSVQEAKIRVVGMKKMCRSLCFFWCVWWFVCLFVS